jgi:hypothetical protein
MSHEQNLRRAFHAAFGDGIPPPTELLHLAQQLDEVFERFVMLERADDGRAIDQREASAVLTVIEWVLARLSGIRGSEGDADVECIRSWLNRSRAELIR